MSESERLERYGDPHAGIIAEALRTCSATVRPLRYVRNERGCLVARPGEEARCRRPATFGDRCWQHKDRDHA